MPTSQGSPRFFRSSTLVLFALFTLAAAHPAIAAIHTVTDFADTGAPGQLRTLMNAAAPGDTIFVPAGTIVLTGAAAENGNASGDLDVIKDLTIVGAGAELTVIDGGGVDRVFEVASGVTSSISGMTLRNGSVDPGAPFDPSGGGVLNRGVLTLADVVVADNFAGGGGGIANLSGGDLTLVGSTVSGNRSTGVTANGGGISNFADMVIDASTISGNEVFGSSSSTLGGGIITLGTMSITNTTISGNRASGNFGGGIYQTPFAISLRLVNVTIVDNETTLAGGGLATVGGKVVMGNTILSGNRVSRRIGVSPDCSGTVDSLGHNLIENNGCTLVGVTAGNQLGRSARLFPLNDNGGPTATHEPRNGSGAIDGGDNALCPAQDQRGEVRPLDGDRNGTAVCDIGAFELRR